MQFLNLFPVPFFRFDYFKAEDLRTSIVDDLLTLEEEDNNDYSLKYPKGSYTSFYSRDCVFDLSKLQELKKFISESVKAADRYLGFDEDLKFTKSWFSINRQYSFHEQHHHCPNIWSGVYYLQADQNDATISFLNKNLIDTGWPYRSKKIENTEFNSTQTVIRPETGMLLVFPSYLHHKVDQQNSTNDRITIAFNMDRKK